MVRSDERKKMAWVGNEIIPHEPSVRAWLRRTLDPEDIEDIIQEAYCRISSLDSIDHIQNGRAYLFTAARMIFLEKIRRARIVKIETVSEFDSLDIMIDEPSPERVVAGRHELNRVISLIESLPQRCRRVFELRKVEGLPQREVANQLGIPEHTVEYEVGKGLKLILKALAEGEERTTVAVIKMEHNDQARDS